MLCLGLVIGNSRLHLALFKDKIIIESWDCNHLSFSIDINQLPVEIFPISLQKFALNKLPVYLASVVPEQTKLWEQYQLLTEIKLTDIPLKGMYETLGIDRALAVWGAGETYGYPCLVIDGGTALTFTGVNSKKMLVGGAILPGVRTQLESLNFKTATLPKIAISDSLPTRWATNTKDAIASGVIRTIIAGINDFIADWCQQFPNSSIIFTGGDGELLSSFLPPNSRTIMNQKLIFFGLSIIVNDCH